MNSTATHNAPPALLQHCAPWSYPMKENDPDKVMAFLAKNIAYEGHAGMYGRSVSELARRFLGEWHYDCTGEEIRGVVRLLQLGMGDAVVSSAQ